MKMRNSRRIDPEKLARIASKGLDSCKLSIDEVAWLASDEGIIELQHISNLDLDTITDAPSHLVHNAIIKYFPDTESSRQPVHVKLMDKAISLLSIPDTWVNTAPAFTFRNGESKSITLSHTENRLTVFVELTTKNDDSADVTIRCNNSKGEPAYPLEIELIKDGRCIESVNVNNADPISLKDIQKGNVTLKVLSNQTEIALDLKIDK